MFQVRQLGTLALLSLTSFTSNGCAPQESSAPTPVSAIPLRTFGVELKLVAVDGGPEVQKWKVRAQFSPELDVKIPSVVSVNICDDKDRQVMHVGELNLPVGTVGWLDFTFTAKKPLIAPYGYAILRDDGVLDLRIVSSQPATSWPAN